ncbi:geranylgeranyl diphosphate synthase, type II [Propionibacterium cyclohexanicum]|uniref:Geranylgeranyl diphosphate synthase, type II n=1 Tax=Propionibacterium cyclohexanicum TaxID=64702 RepID=A0A1H9TJD8_9ACTN|nr:polyprenyl synthetase family protein [Propionibacterium cyclohexanicum]SER97450.1 geranylgeranyl diphosphate synthase, type II [Propionibacterium cyclohexanicum]
MTVSTVRAREELRVQIERELARHLAQRTEVACDYGEQFATLWRCAARHVFGGKLVRPILFVEMTQALTGQPDSAAPSHERGTVITLAAALELLHYSFLLHDDVIDGDLLRRHVPNLIGEMRGAHPASPGEPSLHWGRTSGILMGDLLLAGAHQTFARADVAYCTRLRLLDLLDHTVTESVAGEQADVALSDAVIAPDLQTIVTMMAHKTATYSFELPLRAEAILAGSPLGTERELREAGRHLGLAFQLQDDLMAVFGDAAEHGKDALSDLREAKQTVIIAYARMTDVWPQIAPSFGSHEITVADAERIRELLTRCGAQGFAEQLIDEHVRALYELLAGSLDIPPDAQQVLLTCVQHLEGRRR